METNRQAKGKTMKCPKCGFSSFEIYDNCRKCSADLVAFKQKHGIIPVVLPDAMLSDMASSMGFAATTNNEGNNGYIFTFETPDAKVTADTGAMVDNADSMTIESTAFDSDAVEHDPFAELMGSASQQAEPVQAEANTDQGFELNSFSFDDLESQDSPWESNSDESANASDDNFKSLFGSLDEADSKQAQQ